MNWLLVPSPNLPLSSSFLFIHDDVKADRLPSWVKTAKQITDGHLVELAKAHEAILATLDEKIAEAYLIPEL